MIFFKLILMSMSDDFYYEKYLKYKNKYLKLKELIGGTKYKCEETKRLKGQLCDESDEIGFDSKNECETFCLSSKLNGELDAWKSLIEWVYANIPDIHIYCKGGSALGLVVLKALLDNGYTDQKYQNFIELNLIKDWDFTIINVNSIHQTQIIQKAEELGIQNQASSFPVLRFKKGLIIGQDYLVELSMKESQYLNDLELPMTNLKFIVDPSNIDLFFEVVKIYAQVIPFDDSRLKDNLTKLLSTIVVNGVELVDTINNGLYTIHSEAKLSVGKLSSEMLTLMDDLSLNSTDIINNFTIKQFLITQICEPDRLFSRFTGKNIPKAISIKKFYSNNSIAIPEWLIDNEAMDELDKKINLFLSKLNDYINRAFDTTVGTDLSKVKVNLPKFYEIMNRLFEGINIARLTKEIAKNNSNIIRKLFPYEQITKLRQLKEEEARKQIEEANSKLSPEILKMREESLKRGVAKSEPKKPFDYTKIFTINNTKYPQFISAVINVL
jgi:hypothetical protein